MTIQPAEPGKPPRPARVWSAVGIARLVVLWCIGLAVLVYVPALMLLGALVECFPDNEGFICSSPAASLTFMLFPLVALPAALTVGTASALRPGGRAWWWWGGCLAVLVGTGLAYFGVAIGW
jgi:hypothetical protein